MASVKGSRHQHVVDFDVRSGLPFDLESTAHGHEKVPWVRRLFVVEVENGYFQISDLTTCKSVRVVGAHTIVEFDGDSLIVNEDAETQHEPEDVLICECEMVPKSTVDIIVDSIHEQNGRPDLKSIGVRSRIGKGACQGTICGLRLAAYLYDKEELNSDQGLISLSEFLRERWRGVRPLLWDMPLIQAELQEALYCGLLCLDLYSNKE